jgi:hypothetical protein
MTPYRRACGARISPAGRNGHGGQGGDVVRNANRWFLPFLAIALAGTMVPVAFAQDGPDLPESVDIDINSDNGGEGAAAWYANPVWIAIGVIAAIVLVIVVVLASRGGGGGATVVTR